MTQPDKTPDQRFDDLLRDLGPDVPEPALAEPARRRLLRRIETAAAPRRGPLWVAAVGVSLAAALALVCLLLWARVQRIEDRLATARWETDEVLHLLISARHTQKPVPVPDDLDVHGADLIVLTFHHELCPVAGPCTPLFREMAERHRGDAPRFVEINVTGASREAAEGRIDELDLGYALLGPLGAETGTVKVIDTSSRRVLCSAPGRLGLQQAEQVLAALAEAG